MSEQGEAREAEPMAPAGGHGAVPPDEPEATAPVGYSPGAPNRDVPEGEGAEASVSEEAGVSAATDDVASAGAAADAVTAGAAGDDGSEAESETSVSATEPETSATAAADVAAMGVAEGGESAAESGMNSTSGPTAEAEDEVAASAAADVAGAGVPDEVAPAFEYGAETSELGSEASVSEDELPELDTPEVSRHDEGFVDSREPEALGALDENGESRAAESEIPDSEPEVLDGKGGVPDEPGRLESSGQKSGGLVAAASEGEVPSEPSGVDETGGVSQDTDALEAGTETGAEEAEAEPGTVTDAQPDLSIDETLDAALEALLLVVDVPAGEELLADTLDQPVERIRTALRRLSDGYAESQRGIDLRRVGDGWRFYTRETYAPYVERYLLDGQRAKLTRAALETLAVIAYRQPVTRSRVAAVRGVNVDGVIRTLLARGLIEEAGTDPETGGTLYCTTELFLERLGLSSLKDLPPLAPLLPEVDAIDDV